MFQKLCTFIILIFLLVPTQVQARNIVLVYDDSGSMQSDKKWLKANYALQTLYSLLRDTDTASLVRMSALDNKGHETVVKESLKNRTTRNNINVSLKSIRAQKLPTMKKTPYYAVTIALDVLASLPTPSQVNMTAANEQDWLIIITDGVFSTKNYDNNINNTLNTFEKINNGRTRVAFLFIGVETSQQVYTDWNKRFPALVEPPFVAKTPDDIISEMEKISATIEGRDPQQKVRYARQGNSIRFNSLFPLKRLSILQQKTGAIPPQLNTMVHPDVPTIPETYTLFDKQKTQSGRMTHIYGQKDVVIPTGDFLLEFDNTVAPKTQVLLCTSVDFSVTPISEKNTILSGGQGRYTGTVDKKYRVQAVFTLGENQPIEPKQSEVMDVCLISDSGKRVEMTRSPDKHNVFISKTLVSHTEEVATYSVEAKAKGYFNLKSNILAINFVRGKLNAKVSTTDNSITIPYQFTDRPTKVMDTAQFTLETDNFPDTPLNLELANVPEGVTFVCNNEKAVNNRIQLPAIPHQLSFSVERDKDYTKPEAQTVSATLALENDPRPIILGMNDSNTLDISLIPKTRQVELLNTNNAQDQLNYDVNASITDINAIPPIILGVQVNGKVISQREMDVWRFDVQGSGGGDNNLQVLSKSKDSHSNFIIQLGTDCSPCFAEAGQQKYVVKGYGPFPGDTISTEMGFQVVDDSNIFSRCINELYALLLGALGFFYIYRLIKKHHFSRKTYFDIESIRMRRTFNTETEWTVEEGIGPWLKNWLWPSARESCVLDDFTIYATASNAVIVDLSTSTEDPENWLHNDIPISKNRTKITLTPGSSISIGNTTRQEKYNFRIEKEGE
ncbi:MAG: hypothetical protein ACNI27_13185 [Desulfovibrio sp.]